MRLRQETRDHYKKKRDEKGNCRVERLAGGAKMTPPPDHPFSLIYGGEASVFPFLSHITLTVIIMKCPTPSCSSK
jgi:hypothetical protein